MWKRVVCRLDQGFESLSRDTEATAHRYNRLCVYGVALATTSEDRSSELRVGLNVTNQLFVVELGKKARSGLVARTKARRSGGGRCQWLPALLHASEERGLLVINPHDAEVVGRIFSNDANGKSPRTIAHALTTEGKPGLCAGD